MAANLKTFRICHQKRIANGSIFVSLLPCHKIIDLAQTIREMFFEPKPTWIIIQIPYPRLQLTLAESDAIIESA